MLYTTADENGPGSFFESLILKAAWQEKKIAAAQAEAKANAASTVLTLDVVAGRGLEAKDR